MYRRFTLPLLALLATTTGAAADQPLPWQFGFQSAASPVMDRVVSFHDLLTVIIVGICVVVLGLIAYACWRFREGANPEPSTRSHNTLLEIVWTAVPVLILVVIAVPSFKLLYYEDVIPETELTVKVTGYQWYWGYQYPDYDSFEFVANPVAEGDLQPGQPRLLQTDNEMVVPVGANVRILVTGSDVLHSWAMPAFGVKTDAVPGRLHESWFRVDAPGVYYGQCSELCGVNHYYMPITVRALPRDEFEAWVANARTEFAAADAPRRLATSSTVPTAN